MGNSDQTIREYTLRAISDDYEEFERICQDVTGWASECGLAADRSAILRALEALLTEGYAQAYLLSTNPAIKPQPVSYSASNLDELWFYVTSKGMQRAKQLQKDWR